MAGEVLCSVKLQVSGETNCGSALMLDCPLPYAVTKLDTVWTAVVPHFRRTVPPKMLWWMVDALAVAPDSTYTWLPVDATPEMALFTIVIAPPAGVMIPLSTS